MDLIPSLVTQDVPPSQHAERVQQLVDAIRRSDQPPSVLQLVTALGPYLTSEDDATRTRAIALLAQAISAAPQLVQSPGDVQHLATFFCGRLTDWPAIRGALSGCLALLELPPQAALSPADAVQLLSTFANHVFVRSLGQQDRALALNLLSKAMEAHGQAVLDSRQVDLLEVVTASLEGEKDPRCLLLGLRCVRAAAELYGRQPGDSVHAQKLEEAGEELFDVSAAYFPVAFTPPPNDPHGITRAQLAKELEDTLVVTPLFAPHLLPLLLEKLASSLQQAKLDSLSALGAGASRWGFGPLEGHVSAIWGALRAELLGSGGAGAAAAQAPDVDVQAAAARCLSLCLKVFARDGHWELMDALWGDSAVQDLFACLPPASSSGGGGGEGEGGADAFARRVGRVRAAAWVLAAACQAGQTAASRLYRLALPKVLPVCAGLQATASEAGEGPRPSPDAALVSRCLALSVLLALLQAAGSTGPAVPAAAAVAAAAGAGGGEEESRQGLPLIEEALEAALSMLPTGGTGPAPGQGGQEVEEEGSAGEGEAELWAPERGSYGPQREAHLRLRVAKAVFSLPGAARQLSRGIVEAAAQQLVGCILRGEPEEGSATVAAAAAASPRVGLPSLAAGAIAALCALAADGQHGELVAQHALPPLAAAAAPGNGVQPAPSTVQRAALSAVQQLAASHPALHAAALSFLDGAIQHLLPAAVSQPAPPGAGSGTAGPSPVVLAGQLLEAAREVVVAGAGGAGPDDGVPSLAAHLFSAVMELPASQAPPGGMDPRLLGACASTLFHAVRLAPEQAQQAFLADSGCLAQLQRAAAAAATAPAGGQPAGPAAAGAARPQRSVGALQLAACSAVLAALRPAALAPSSSGLTPAQLQGLVGALLSQALAPAAEAHASVEEAGASAGAAGWAALAAATVPNKWQPDSADFHKTVHGLLEAHLFPLTIGAPGSPEPETTTALAATPRGAALVRRAWACLALVAKGLVMRGHPAAEGVLSGVLSLLSEAEAAAAAGADAMSTDEGAAELAVAWPAQQGGLVVRAASRLFGDILAAPGASELPAEPPAVGLPNLGPETHALARPLWQQRFYTLQCGALLRALSSQPGPSAPAAGGEGGPNGASPLLLALAQLIRGAPPAALRSDWGRALPWAARCLGVLLAGRRQPRGAQPAGVSSAAEEGQQQEEKALVQALLGTLCEALMDEGGQRQCEGLLPQLVPALLAALQYRASHQVRERAAQGLLLLVQLPYSSLHAYRGTVTRGLVHALDDDRRVVRLQAAQARQAWEI